MAALSCSTHAIQVIKAANRGPVSYIRSRNFNNMNRWTHGLFYFFARLLMVPDKSSATHMSKPLGIDACKRLIRFMARLACRSLQAPTATYLTGPATTPSGAAYTLQINVTYSTDAVQLPFSNPAAVSQGIIQVATGSTSPQVLKGTAVVSHQNGGT